MTVEKKFLSWNTIARMIENGDFRFDRSQQVTDKYAQHKEQLQKQWRDINSYCKHYKLGYPYQTEEIAVENECDKEPLKYITKKYVDESVECPGPRLVILDNEFPYEFSPDISHKVIWSADEIPVGEYQKFVESHYSKRDYDLIVFVNPTYRKSVRGVHHAHALIRKKVLPQLMPNNSSNDQPYFPLSYTISCES